MSIADADSIEDLPDDFFDDFTKGDFLDSLRRAAESGDFHPEPPAYERSCESSSSSVDVHDRLIQEIRRLEKDIAERRRKLCRSPLKSNFTSLRNHMNSLFNLEVSQSSSGDVYFNFSNDCDKFAQLSESTRDKCDFEQNSLKSNESTFDISPLSSCSDNKMDSFGRDVRVDRSHSKSRANDFINDQASSSIRSRTFASPSPKRGKSNNKISPIQYRSSKIDAFKLGINADRSRSKSISSDECYAKYQKSSLSSKLVSHPSTQRDKSKRDNTPIQYRSQNNYLYDRSKYKWEKEGYIKNKSVVKPSVKHYCEEKHNKIWLNVLNEKNHNQFCKNRTSNNSRRSCSQCRINYKTKYRQRSRSPIRPTPRGSNRRHSPISYRNISRRDRSRSESSDRKRFRNRSRSRNFSRSRSRSRTSNRSCSLSKYRSPEKPQKSFLEELAHKFASEGRDFPEGNNKINASLIGDPSGFSSIQTLGSMLSQLQCLQNNVEIYDKYGGSFVQNSPSVSQQLKKSNKRPKHSPILAPIRHKHQQRLNSINVCIIIYLFLRTIFSLIFQNIQKNCGKSRIPPKENNSKFFK